MFKSIPKESIILALTWEELIEGCKNCTRCELANNRRNVVIGRGNANACMMLIGEGPGEQEDIQGKPFVGPAGQLLDLLLSALMIKEEDYYIANIVKCRPPHNRDPEDREAEKCLPFLRAQVKLIQPKIIVCMGRIAVKYILRDNDIRITNIRGQWQERKGFSIMPTFHPAALLRDESKKILMWEDFKKVRQRLKEIKLGGHSG
jgi:uracil-DNA glycosylase family 4